MNLLPDNIYHIYNRGNNEQRIFFNNENYLFFLKKIRKHLLSLIEFICYCLMPNHFHFLVYTPLNFKNEKSSNEFRVLLSSYTRAINIQENRTGSLFQQNSKAKCLTYFTSKTNFDDYGLTCFNYIHQNPLLAGLVEKIEDWEYSSFRDYIGMRNDDLCNISLSKKLLGLPDGIKKFYEQSYELIDNEKTTLLY